MDNRSPYVDIELCVPADESYLSVARSIAAGIVCLDGDDPDYADDVRLVVDEIVSMLILVGRAGSTVRCLFRVLDSEVRVNVCVDSGNQHLPELEPSAAWSTLLDTFVDSASTVAVSTGEGGYSIRSDVVIPNPHRG